MAVVLSPKIEFQFEVLVHFFRNTNIYPVANPSGSKGIVKHFIADKPMQAPKTQWVLQLQSHETGEALKDTKFR
jgi:hypothetical protein